MLILIQPGFSQRDQLLIPVTMFRITGTNSTRNRIGVFLALASAGPRDRHGLQHGPALECRLPTPWPDLIDGRSAR
jgi:hypothetical protein